MIEVEEDVCDGQAQQGNEHEVVRIGEGLPAGSEGCQNFRKEKKRGNHQHHSGNQTHDEDVAKRTLSSFLVFSSQPDGADGRPADAYQRAQRESQVHDGEGDGQAGQGQRPTPWPINTLSMMLYREYTTMPAMEGREYWISRRHTDAFSNSAMLRDWAAMGVLPFKTGSKL